MNKVKEVILFGNGNIAAFDENNNQIAELQIKNAIQLWADYADELGFDVSKCKFRTLVGHKECNGIIAQDFDGFYLKWSAI